MTATMQRPPGLCALDLPREDLKGRSILVTGGSMGIGFTCAAEAAACGADVVIAARGWDALEAAAARLRSQARTDIHAVAADVSREDDVERLVAATLERHGRLDGVIHAAAVLGPIGPATEVSPEEWFDAVRIDLFGTFLVARAAARSMRGQGAGRIVLLSGGGATSGFPNYTAYASSKAAVVRLAESLGAELAPDGIAVNALAPGFVTTRLHCQTLEAGERAGAGYLRSTVDQLEAGGVPAEVAARAATFLLSDRSRGITGRLVAAPWDRWWEWPERRPELGDTDLFMLRRIVPRDRGKDWQ